MPHVPTATSNLSKLGYLTSSREPNEMQIGAGPALLYSEVGHMWVCKPPLPTTSIISRPTALYSQKPYVCLAHASIKPCGVVEFAIVAEQKETARNNQRCSLETRRLLFRFGYPDK